MREGVCQREQVIAYLDGELDSRAQTAFEQHVEKCCSCRDELRAHRLVLCELDAAMAQEPDVSTPSDFARIVAAHAETDMRGVRSRREHKQAIRLIVIVGLAAFALLGAPASDSIIGGARLIAKSIFGLVSFLWMTVYDTAASAAVISKVLTRKFVIESGSLGLAVVFLCLSVVLLTRLISNYHRARAIE